MSNTNDQPSHAIERNAIPTHKPQKRQSSKRHQRAKVIRDDVLMVLAGFVGTYLFLWSAFMGTQTANANRSVDLDSQSQTTPDNQTIHYISLSFGLSLVVTAWVFFRVSGSAFNPFISLALYLIGNTPLKRTILVMIAQMVGGIAAAATAQGLSIGESNIETTLAVGLRPRNGMAIEMIATALLVFTVLMTSQEKNKSTFLAPLAIGLSLFVGMLAATGSTGAGLNPARTFGPCPVNGRFPSYAWIYYVGQFLGSLVATLAYQQTMPNIDSEKAAHSTNPQEGPVMQALRPLSRLSNITPDRNAENV